MLSWLFGLLSPSPIPAESRILTATRQHWTTMRPVIDRWETLAEQTAPYKIALDFTTFESSDAAEIDVSALIHGENPGNTVWVPMEKHNIGIAGVEGTPFLMVNKAITNAGKLLVIEPLDGPWIIRVRYRQTQGIAKAVRFMGFRTQR